MNTDIKVELIASITALIIASGSFITVFINHRLSKKVRKQRLINDNLLKNLEAIDQVNISLQIFKDTITYIVNGAFDDTESALKKIITDTDNIVKIYDSVFVDMDESEKYSAHYVKNKIIQFSIILKNTIYEVKDIKNISTETKKLLRNLKENITETQNVLIFNKNNKLKCI